jgi:hypothetical protein
MLQKPGFIARRNIMELYASLAFKQHKKLSREFNLLLSKLLGQRMRNPKKEVVFEANLFD